MLTDAVRSHSCSAAFRLPTPVTDSQFARWTALLQQRLGMDPRSVRRSFLSRALYQRLLELGLDDVQQYYDLLHTGPQQDEWMLLLDLVTTHETRFFRHPSTLAVAQAHCRHLMAEGREVRAWSLGCSTGEETWSLAVLFAECQREFSHGEFSVIGTDISLRCLTHARRGEYHQRQIRSTPKELLDRYFVRNGLESASAGTLLRQHTRFACMDALAAGNAAVGSMDIIYCHNLLIYLDEQHRRQALDNMVPALCDGGLLIAGPGETHNWGHPSLQSYRDGDTTLFRKIRS